MRSGGRGGDDGPRDWGSIDWSNIDLSGFRRGPSAPSGRGSFFAILAGLLVFVPLIVAPIVSFFTDLAWFRSLGYEQVFLLRFTASFWAFSAFFLFFFAFALVNLYFALRPRLVRIVVAEARPQGALAQTLRLAWLLLIPAFFFGIAGADQWDTILRFQNASAFGQTDPLFGRDIGFYFFTLPLFEFVRGWLLGAVIVSALGVGLVYVVRGAVGVATGPLTSVDLGATTRTVLSLARPARAHLSVLGGLFLGLLAVGYVFDQYDLLFREEGIFSGAGYTSVTARLPALQILTVVVGLAAVACLANSFLRSLWLLGGSLGLWLVATILVEIVYPSLVQTLVVSPDQLNKERPYIQRNIEATRAAYGLANVEESSLDLANSPTPADARRDLGDTAAVRLWDYRPLLDSFQQLQGLRQYYAFNDVDVDRYTLGGVERSTMMAARELDHARLPREARSWVNLHLYYTHGFGATLTNVGAVTPEGLPRFSLRDIPPQGEPRIDQPRIYYGELTKNYAIVGTSQAEFDYVQEGRDATSRFDGAGGVVLSNVIDRLLFAVRFGDLNLLISGQITPESRILFHRVISDRQELLAPFLHYDNDPYLVVADGKLYWMNDAYTTGSRYPYSKPVGALRRNGALLADPRMNYIRNSVKVVTDAYDGTVRYYVIDETDPVIRTIRSIYPSLFRPISEMPRSIAAHIRYPEDLFSIQTQIFTTYHMEDPDNFYNRGDAWKVATEIFAQGGAPQPMEPYYVTARLPGSSRTEFILFVPLTPAGTERDNMVAWIAGRADPPEYGRMRVLRFPKDRTIFGPLQIEARIEADSNIRQQITLLSSGRGASLIRGNLLVLPVGDSFVYVKPLFVQASEGRIPELRRVILATQDRVVMEDTFERALERLFVGAAPTPSPSPIPAPSPGATPRPSATPAPSG
ncbi:MAG: UPF0182 family protein, partial [Chloroflexi bacterium]|nr:UPF0182 family protein [Chloroflexota bacterium]